MRKTGLFNLMEKHVLSNLVDYVTGVEAGLDSNGRKNRGGHLMENLVEAHLRKAGLVAGDTYFKEMTIGAVEAKQIDGFEFVWFTDGQGWRSARNNLEETFDAMEHIYSIADLESGIAERLFG